MGFDEFVFKLAVKLIFIGLPIAVVVLIFVIIFSPIWGKFLDINDAEEEWGKEVVKRKKLEAKLRKIDTKKVVHEDLKCTCKNPTAKVLKTGKGNIAFCLECAQIIDFVNDKK